MSKRKTTRLAVLYEAVVRLSAQSEIAARRDRDGAEGVRFCDAASRVRRVIAQEFGLNLDDITIDGRVLADEFKAEVDARDVAEEVGWQEAQETLRQIDALLTGAEGRLSKSESAS